MHKIEFKHGPQSWTIVAHPALASYQQGELLQAPSENLRLKVGERELNGRRVNPVLAAMLLYLIPALMLWFLPVLVTGTAANWASVYGTAFLLALALYREMPAGARLTALGLAALAWVGFFFAGQATHALMSAPTSVAWVCAFYLAQAALYRPWANMYKVPSTGLIFFSRTEINQGTVLAGAAAIMTVAVPIALFVRFNIF